MPTIDSLDDEIRALYAELIDAVPPPPSLEELWEIASNGRPVRKQRPDRGRHLSRWATLVAAVGTAILLVVGLLVFLPSKISPNSNAAAAELRQIAVKAERQSPVTLEPGQWLMTKTRVSTLIKIFRTHRIEIRPNQYGTINYPTTKAQSVIAATIREWTNMSGTECVSETSVSVAFASSTDRTAWMATGADVRPNRGLLAGLNCLHQGLVPTVINVAELPTDPKVLAKELTNGTLGVTGLDQFGGEDVALIRATAILLGPTIGSTPRFNAALLRAVALIPGIHAIGELTTHEGKIGSGFTAPGIFGPLTIILDPSTGALLEASGVDTSQFYSFYSPTVLMRAFETHANGSFAQRASVNWMDPIGMPSAVDRLSPG